MDNNELHENKVAEEHSSEHSHNKGESHNSNLKNDLENEKVWCGLAYLIFFLPLILIPKSKNGKYHANQGLILLLTSVVGSIVLGFVPYFGYLLMVIFKLGIFILFIIGLMNGFSQKEKPLPLIGHLFNIIK